MKALLRLLEYIGFIQCAHNWGNWKDEIVNYYDDRGKLLYKSKTSFQTKTCTKCGRTSRWVI